MQHSISGIGTSAMPSERYVIFVVNAKIGYVRLHFIEYGACGVLCIDVNAFCCMWSESKNSRWVGPVYRIQSKTKKSMEKPLKYVWRNGN